MSRFARIALGLGFFLGLGVQLAVASSGVDLRGPGSAGSAPTFTTVNSGTGNFDFIDAGVVNIEPSSSAAECAVGMDISGDGFRAICLNRRGGLGATTDYLGYNGGTVTLNSSGNINLNTGSGNTVQLPSNTKLCFVTGGTQCLQRSTDSILALSSALSVSSDISTGSTGDIIAGRSIFLTPSGSNRLTWSDTAVTVVACSGTAASIVWVNGTASFRFDVGTSCAGESTATITFTAMTNEPTCSCFIRAGTVTNLVQTSGSTTTAVLTNYSKTTGLAVDFTDGDDVQCACTGG